MRLLAYCWCRIPPPHDPNPLCLPPPGDCAGPPSGQPGHRVRGAHQPPPPPGIVQGRLLDSLVIVYAVPTSPLPLGIAQGRLLDSLVIVYAVPTSPGRCRLINRNVVRFKGGPSSIISKVVRWERKGQERGGSGGRKGGQVV